MCGRFVLKSEWVSVQALYDHLGMPDTRRNIRARYNIAPTQEVFFVARDDGETAMMQGRWWLVPHWATEVPKYTMFNARSEDAYKKPAFRESFRGKRCLIPADGYFEWSKNEKDGKRDPWYITLKEREAFSFAGLWAFNEALGVVSCTILTAESHDAVSNIHHRMPLILPKASYKSWISGDTGSDEAREILHDNLGSELVAERVNRKVNNARYDAPDCIDPDIADVGEQASLF